MTMEKETVNEIEDIEREISQQSKKISKRVRRAVNPQRGFVG